MPRGAAARRDNSFSPLIGPSAIIVPLRNNALSNFCTVALESLRYFHTSSRLYETLIVRVLERFQSRLVSMRIEVGKIIDIFGSRDSYWLK